MNVFYHYHGATVCTAIQYVMFTDNTRTVYVYVILPYVDLII